MTDNAQNHVPPGFKRTGFHCPQCGVFAHQTWSSLLLSGLGYVLPEIRASQCARCHERAYWISEELVHPAASMAPLPNPDMPVEVREEYDEARSILDKSPRGAAVLLRVGVENLCKHIGARRRSLNKQIEYLVAQGLSPDIQRALDSVRVIGNNAVHPGQMDLRDDRDTAEALFSLVNLIVEKMISDPKKITGVFEKLPAGVRDAIKERDEGTKN